MFGEALLAPRLAWPRIMRQRTGAGWMYLCVGVESYLMRPEAAIRGFWALGRRGVGQVVPLVRLGSLQCLWLIGVTVVLSLALRVTRRGKGVAFGEWLELAPWAYAPKLLVTVAFALAWLVGLVPSNAMLTDGLPGGAAIAYHALSLVAVGWSIAALLAANPERIPGEPRFRFARYGVAAAVTALALGFAQHGVADPARYRPIGTGDRVAALDFLALTDQATNVRFPVERPVVIDFWASWCGPCVDALPAWQALSANNASATFISANVELDNADYVKRFAAEQKLAFPIVLAPGALQARFQVETLPTTVLLSAQGEVVGYWVGAVSAATLKTAIAAAMR